MSNGDTEPTPRAKRAPKTNARQNKPGPKRGSDEAKRGGTAARAKLGVEHYRRIGAKGGSTVKQRHGLEFYAEIGRRGGETTKRNRGTDHYARIGQMGGRRSRKRGAEPADSSSAPDTTPRA